MVEDYALCGPIVRDWRDCSARQGPQAFSSPSGDQAQLRLGDFDLDEYIADGSSHGGEDPPLLGIALAVLPMLRLAHCWRFDTEDGEPSEAAAEHAELREIDEPAGVVATVAGLDGIWAQGADLRAVKTELVKVLIGWALIKIEDGDDDIPSIDGVSLYATR